MMLTQQRLIEEIRQLSVADRVALLELISRSLREDLAASPDDSRAPVQKATFEEFLDTVHAKDKPTLSRRLRGVIKFDGPPPTDEELKDAYADYLLEKYS